jgi:hypothetical protein
MRTEKKEEATNFVIFCLEAKWEDLKRETFLLLLEAKRENFKQNKTYWSETK